MFYRCIISACLEKMQPLIFSYLCQNCLHSLRSSILLRRYKVFGFGKGNSGRSPGRSPSFVLSEMVASKEKFQISLVFLIMLCLLLRALMTTFIGFPLNMLGNYMKVQWFWLEGVPSKRGLTSPSLTSVFANPHCCLKLKFFRGRVDMGLGSWSIKENIISCSYQPSACQ